MDKIRTIYHGNKPDEQLKIIGDTVNKIIDKIQNLEDRIKELEKRLETK